MKEKKKLYLAIGIIIAVMILIIRFSFHRSEPENENKGGKEDEDVITMEEINFSEGIQIVDSGTFSGTFVEDGTDEDVDGVAALTVANHSEKWLEYAQIIVSAGDDTYEFSVSALPANSTARILEQQRKVFGEADDFDVELKNVVFYEETPSLHSDIFKISAENQQITVKNISDKAISGDIFIYYKTKMDGVYIGGIAYRAKVEGGLAPGEEKTCYARHYLKESSELLFVTYVE